MRWLVRLGLAGALLSLVFIWPAGLATAAAPLATLRQATPRVVGIRADGPPTTLGSAVTVGDRLAVTAAHVVAGARGLSLVFLDGTVVPVRSVVNEPAADLAVLRADRSLPAQPFSLRQEPVRVGESQVVVGYRQDLAEQPSVKYGVVTGLLRPGAPGPDGRDWPLIASTTAASFGDSGGAVLDTESRLTGIVRGGLSTGSATSELLSTPVGAIAAYLARGWVLDRNGNPVSSQPGQPSLAFQPYPIAAPWWR